MSSNRAGRFQLWSVHLDGNPPSWQPSIPAYDPGSPALARSGGRLVYEEWSFDFSIWRQRLANGLPDGDPERIAASTEWDLHPQYSPDSRRIAFSSNRSGSNEIWLADADGGNLRRLTTESSGFVGSPRWSPDAEALVFERHAVDGQGIYVVDAGGGTPRLLAQDGFSPSWSRDGKWIYYGSNRDGVWKIWRLSVEEGTVEPITASGAHAAREDMRGEMLYFARFAEPGLWRKPLTGGPEELVIEQLDEVDAMSWEVTDDGIYFVDRREGEERISFFDFRTRVTGVVMHPPNPIPPGKSSLSVSPDGSSLLFGQIDEQESDIVLVDGIDQAF